MEEAIKDLSWSPFAPASASPAQIASQAIEKRRQVNTRPRRPRRLALAAGLAFMAVIIFGVGLILGHSGLDWRGNISRLSQRLFQTQKISQGGGAGKIQVTTLAGDKVQASTAQEVEVEGSSAKKVETDPVPAEKDKAVSVPVEKSEADPVPAEKIEAARVSVEGDEAPGVVPDRIGSASAATAGQANSLLDSVDTTEESKKEVPQLARKETTKESDAKQAPQLPRQRLPLELSIRPGDTLAAIINQHYGSFNKETLRAVLHENAEIQNPDQILMGAILKMPLLSEKP